MFLKHLICYLLISLIIVPTGWASQQRAIRLVSLKMPTGEQVELYKGSYALVIGASEYQDNAWGDLSSVGEDVKAVRQALEGQGFQVQTVMDPTEDDLIDEINDFIDAHGYEQDNRLLFYYAGHGYTQERNGRKFGYLVPVDAPNPYDNERAFFRKSLKMEQILSWAKQIESKHALFVFDSCFSGSVLQSRAVAVPEDISYSTAKPVRQFLSAGSANQTVPAISVFRPLFIRGIEGKADLDQDGYVTGVELGMFLQKQVPRYQTGQTPQYGKILDPYLDEGNFVFEVKRQPPKPKRQAAPPAVASVELGDLQEQADDAEKARLEQQRLEQARLEEQRLEQARQEQQKLEQARLEQQRIKNQWQEWQQGMQNDYDKVFAFEKQEIENKLKIESWERFLSSWKNKNPYSEQDNMLRITAQIRIIYWQEEIQKQKKEQQALKQQENKVNVVLSGSEALNKPRKTRSCENCNLQGAHWTGRDLRYANLKNSDLRKANLYRVNLRWANLKDTDLTGANLNNVYLTGADLTGANLKDTDLYNANLKNTNLTGAFLLRAYLYKANLTDAYGGARFCNTTMPDGSINNDDC